MTKVTIDRELLERIDESAICDGTDATISDDLFTQLVGALDAPRQPEGDGLEVVASQFPEINFANYGQDEVEALQAWGFTALDAMADAQRAIAELREEISDLHTTMMAAAVEIQEHWQAHCDEEGYGPANLMNRLERGIAAQYGYTAQTVVQIEAERDTLRQQLAEREATIARLETGIPRIQEQSHQMRQQRDRLAGLLADVKADYTHAIHWEDMHATMKRIDAALAEVKPCLESPAPTT